jgi:hypothetical protein
MSPTQATDLSRMLSLQSYLIAEHSVGLHRGKESNKRNCPIWEQWPVATLSHRVQPMVLPHQAAPPSYGVQPVVTPDNVTQRVTPSDHEAQLMTLPDDRAQPSDLLSCRSVGPLTKKPGQQSCPITKHSQWLYLILELRLQHWATVDSSLQHC